MGGARRGLDPVRDPRHRRWRGAGAERHRGAAGRRSRGDPVDPRGPGRRVRRLTSARSKGSRASRPSAIPTATPCRSSSTRRDDRGGRRRSVPAMRGAAPRRRELLPELRRARVPLGRVGASGRHRRVRGPGRLDRARRSPGSGAVPRGDRRVPRDGDGGDRVAGRGRRGLHRRRRTRGVRHPGGPRRRRRARDPRCRRRPRPGGAARQASSRCRSRCAFGSASTPGRSRSARPPTATS